MRVLVVCPDPAIDAYVWLDRFDPGGINRASREERYPGGKGTHVAMALRQMGADVCLVGMWLGPTGTWIREQCELRGIDVAGPVTAGFARTCLTFRGPVGVELTELRGCSDLPDHDAVNELIAAFENHIGQADAAVVSGRWPSGRGPETCGHLVTRAQQSDVPVCVDCEGDTLATALKCRPDLVHLNRDEGEAFTRLSDPSSMAQRLAVEAAAVGVSAGADGLFVASGSRLVHAVSPVEHLISTVGAGDCLTAGMVWGHLIGDGDLDTVARWGVACGAASCIWPELGILRRSDVDGQLTKTTLSVLDRPPRPGCDDEPRAC